MTGEFAEELPTPEEWLEAAVWRAMQEAGVTTDRPLEFIQAVVFAAIAYAAGDSEVLTAARRRVLARTP